MSSLTIWTPETGEMVPMPGQRFTSLDLTKAEGQRMAYRCHVAADMQLIDMVGEDLLVRDFYAHHVIRLDEATGEKKPGTRCVLITQEGDRISTGSESAMKCMMAWAALSGLTPPWIPPLHFIVRADKSSKGPGKYLWLDIPE